MSNEKFKVKFGLAVGDTAATIDGTTGDIVTDGDIQIKGNDIKSNTGATAIELSGADIITGDIQLNGGDIRSASGNIAISVSNTDAIVAGDLTVNGGDLITTVSLGNLFNTSATTLNIGGAATTVSIGNNVGTTTVNNALAADSITTSGDAAINGGDITTSATTATVFNATATTLNMGGAATTVNIGADTGTTTVNNALVADSITTSGDAAINGGDITTSSLSATVFNATATTVNIAGAATTVTIGADTGTTTVNNDLVADSLSISGSLKTNTVTTTSGNLTLNTASGVNSGSIVITAGANGNITTTPNGTGNAAFTMSNGGNITNTRNYVYGAIRDATTQANGDMWSFSSGTGTGYRGVSLDNSTDTTKRPSYLVRSYGGGLASGAPRSAVLFENSRGSAASPTALSQFDALGEIVATGRTSTGWVSDLINATPAAQNFYAAEAFVSTTNVGAGWLLRLQPTGTTLTAAGASLISVIDASPQQFAQRTDSYALSAGKTTSFVATGCSISGTTLTIGTLTSGSISVGTAVQTTTGAFMATYITANISGSGSGSTWTLSQSQTTASGLTIVGYKGAIGYAPAISTVDILQPMKLYNGTITSRDNTLTYNNNSGTNMITMTSAGKFTVTDPTSATTASRNFLQLDNPTSNTSDDNMTLSLQLTNSNGAGAATEFPVFNFTNFRYNTGGSVYVPTQNNDLLGGFKFNGQYSSTGTSSIGMPTQIQAFATENWTSTAQGSKVVFTVNKKGATTGVTAISAASDATTFQSDSFTFQDSTGTSVVGSSKINYNRVYGQWQYDATITPAGANTAYAFPFQGANATTDFANIASAASTSRIIPGAAGTYRLAFSLQLENTDNAAEHVAYIWWRKNGVDISNSMGRIYVGKQLSVIAAWDNMVQTSNATDYFELMYAVDNTALVFPYYGTTAFGPATASIFLNLVPVGA